MLEVGGAYAFLDRFEAGLRMPFYSQSGRGDTMLDIPSARGAALGDLTVHAKGRFVRSTWLTAGAVLHVTLPTSTSGRFTGNDLPSVRVLGLATLAPVPRLTLSFAPGAAELAPIAPARAHLADADGDGIADEDDSCPKEAEDRNGIRDQDGCPDADADRDAIIDVRDKCPQQAEDRDGYQDGDGCPELDNDGDGIADAQDRCPMQPETINGNEDDDGCPDGGDTAVHIDVNPDQSPVKAAEATFRHGRELMKEKKHFAACAAFEQSQRLDPQAGTQYNLAGCYIEIGKLATAWNLYRELVRTDKNAERRDKSNELATQLAPRVPRLKLSLVGMPRGVNVFMNGTNVNALIGLETPIDLGTYTIVAGAPGYRGWRQTVEVKREGELVTVEIDLGPLKP